MTQYKNTHSGLVAVLVLVCGWFTFFPLQSTAQPAPGGSPAAAEKITAKGPKGDNSGQAWEERHEKRQEWRRRMMEGFGDGEEGTGDGEKGPGMDKGRIGHVGRFIQFVKRYHETVMDPRQAAGLAALSIKKAYKKDGKELEAVPVIEEALASTQDRQMRNILLFNLRQIYEDTKSSEKLMTLNKQILKENLDSLKAAK